jgi:hypothetical protein
METGDAEPPPIGEGRRGALKPGRDRPKHWSGGESGAGPKAMQVRSGPIYNAFKYAVFALLAIDIAFYYELNSAAEGFTFKDGVSFSDFVVAYADAIDSFAWVGLLLMFEIETSIDPPEHLHKRVTAIIGALTLLCWAGIIYAFFGYVGGLDLVRGFSAWAGPDPCNLAGEGSSYAISLDEYVPLDAANCRELGAKPQHNAALSMFASADAFSMIKRLTWTDIVNAGTWIVLAALIEFEIMLRAVRRATPALIRRIHLAQAPLWAILVINVFYWLALGEPFEAYDASLWIACFFFIELNMMAKHEARARRRAEREAASPQH